jgi:hypothetical protein
MASRW